jgi:hypothetical protein
VSDNIEYNLSCIAASMPDRRERIATAALQGLLADPTIRIPRASDCAAWAVELADALIAELDKEMKP